MMDKRIHDDQIHFVKQVLELKEKEIGNLRNFLNGQLCPRLDPTSPQCKALTYAEIHLLYCQSVIQEIIYDKDLTLVISLYEEVIR